MKKRLILFTMLMALFTATFTQTSYTELKVGIGTGSETYLDTIYLDTTNSHTLYFNTCDSDTLSGGTLGFLGCEFWEDSSPLVGPNLGDCQGWDNTANDYHANFKRVFPANSTAGTFIYKSVSYDVSGNTTTTDTSTIVVIRDPQGPDNAMVGTGPVTNITATTANVGNVIKNHYQSRYVIYGTNPNLTWANKSGYTYIPQGHDDYYVATLSNLTPNTQYYTRAYNTAVGDDNYGEVRSFTTLALLPTLLTTDLEVTGGTTIEVGGAVLNNGGATITEKGVCWGTSPNPDTTNKVIETGTPIIAEITGLTPNTLYYARTYAVNSAGIGYGPDTSGTTTDYAEIEISSTDYTSCHKFAVTAEITGTGGDYPTEVGIVWSSTNSTPVVDVDPTFTNPSVPAFPSIASFQGYTDCDLTANTSYYVRAYIENTAGIAYSAVETITTAAVGAPIVATIGTTAVGFEDATLKGSVTNLSASVITGGFYLKEGPLSTTFPGSSDTIVEATSFTMCTSNDGDLLGNATGLKPSTTYTFRAFATNSAGTTIASERKEFTTNAAPTPVANLVISPDPADPDETITFDASGSVGYSLEYSFKLDAGSDWTQWSTDSIITTSQQYSGDYTGQVNIRSTESPSSTYSTSVDYDVTYYAPIINFNFNGSDEDTLDTENTTTYCTPNMSWYWEIEDGTTYSTFEIDDHVLPGAGSYSVTLTATQTSPAWTDSVTYVYDAIVEGFEPSVRFQSFPSTGYAGDTIDFYVEAYANPPYTVKWRFGDEVGEVWTTGSDTMRHVYSTANEYLVEVKITDKDNFTDSISNAIEIFAPHKSAKINTEAIPITTKKYVGTENKTGYYLIDKTTNTFFKGHADEYGRWDDWGEQLKFTPNKGKDFRGVATLDFDGTVYRIVVLPFTTY